MRGAALLAGALLASALFACGPAKTAPPTTTPAPDPLTLGPAATLLPAPGLAWVVLARPRELAAVPEIAAAADALFPPEERAGYIEAHGGVDPFAAKETAFARYRGTDLLYVRAPFDPARAEAAATKRLLLEGRALDGHGAVIRLFGAGTAAEGGLRGRSVALLGREGYLEEEGLRRPLAAAEARALGKLPDRFSIAAAEGLSTEDWPLVFLAPGPFEGGLGGLLRAATQATIRLRPAPGAPDRVQVKLALTGPYGRDPEGAARVADAQLARIAGSDLGRLLGLDGAPRGAAKVVDGTLVAEITLPVGRLAAGLRAATRGDARALAETLDGPRRAPGGE